MTVQHDMTVFEMSDYKMTDNEIIDCEMTDFVQLATRSLEGAAAWQMQSGHKINLKYLSDWNRYNY